MTIRNGETYVFETFSQFCVRLDVDWDEIAQVLPVQTQEQMIADENEAIESMGGTPIDDVTAVTDDLISEYVHHQRGMNRVVQDVLEARDTEYVHSRDVSLHHVVELEDTLVDRVSEALDGDVASAEELREAFLEEVDD